MLAAIDMLSARYRTKFLEPLLHTSFGKVIQTDDSLVISQPAYTTNILKQHGMLDFKPSSTPCLTIIDLRPRQPYEKALDTKQYPYSRILGSASYLVDSTSPDMALMTGNIARDFNPTPLIATGKS